MAGSRRSRQQAAARALRALERGATSLGAQVARSVNERRHHRRTVVEAAPPAVAPAVAAAGEAPAAPEPAVARDVSEIEVRDLRAELARELERLSGADIAASRGAGRLADGASPADSPS